MMKKLWNKIRSIKRNTIIRNSFLLPILSVVAMSISHVISWYDLGNPMMWAIYLSIAVEVFALASVSAASLKMKKGSIWMLFGIVTFIQIVGNVFFTYKDIDPTGEGFKAWVELIQPLFEDWTITDHKRLLAYVQGGTLPFMSLIALHFYIKFNENIQEEEEAKLTVKAETMEDLASDFGLDKEEEIIDTISEEVSNEIDKNLHNVSEITQDLVDEYAEREQEISEEIDLDKLEVKSESKSEDMIPDAIVKEALREEQRKQDELPEQTIVQKVIPKIGPDINMGQIKGHRPKENPGQNPQIMPGTN